MLIIIYFGRAYITGAPYAVSTPNKTKMLVSLLGPHTQGAKAVDMGSGDGRVEIALAQAGFEAYGFETNPSLVWLSRSRLKRAGLEGKAFIQRANYWTYNLGEYDAVGLFGVFYMMKKMQAKLKKELKTGALVVSNHYKFPDWQEVRKENNIYIYKT